MSALSPRRPPKPRRRWLQFNLRTLLVLMLVTSVPLGWLAYKLKQAREQRATIDAIHALGGFTEYEGKRDIYTDDGLPSMPFGIDFPPDCPAPAWLRRCLGDDFFVRIIAVNGESDEVLEHAARLPHLSSLRVGPLHCHPFVESYPVTDAGLEHLKASSQLHTLMLTKAEVTDAGLTHLQGLTQLQYLDLSGTQVTAAGVAGLKKALPNCRIVR